MAGSDKRTDDLDLRSEEIIEETMHEITEHISKKNTEVETDGEVDSDVDSSNSIPADDRDSEATKDDTRIDVAGAGVFYLDDEEDTYKSDEEEYEDEEYEDEEYEDEEEIEETSAEQAQRKHKKRKKMAIVFGAIVGVFALVYFGFAWFFSSHFLFFTQINGTDFSMKSAEQVEVYMQQQVANYELTLNETNQGKEIIKGTDISLEYVSGKEIEKLVKEQNSLLWVKSIFQKPVIKAEMGVKYDENALVAAIGKLQCMVPENQTASVDAHPQFQDPQFVVIPEVYGTQIDVEKFNAEIRSAISGFIHTLDMNEAKCYQKPRFVAESPEVIAAKDVMNRYLGASVTYDFNPSTEVVNAAAISQWVQVDADMNVTFNEEAVRGFVGSLAEKYNTRGKTRTFVAGNGNTVSVEGGGYGWRIDQEAEYNALVANIQNAEVITREAHFSSRAISHGEKDFGDTYAEVDLTNQQIFFIQNGQVVLQSACVTGNPNKGYATPPGLFSLAYKATDQILRGQRMPDGSLEYETPVKYWMPFNGGIGFHDATWQPAFGGSRYQTVGSHGCVNLPYDVAGQLYGLLSAGTPVVAYF